eukprot:15476374-Alexandrium_andersonii.AAC.1
MAFMSLGRRSRRGVHLAVRRLAAPRGRRWTRRCRSPLGCSVGRIATMLSAPSVTGGGLTARRLGVRQASTMPTATVSAI